MSGAVFWLALNACSGSGTKSDAAAEVSSDTSGLVPCSKKGEACETHDPCSINPICGDDLLCHPQGYQNCDDNLDCTDDFCGAVAGSCENKPKAGSCLISVKNQSGTSELKCYTKDEQKPDDPCLICDPTQQQFTWSPRNGGLCDDANNCTFNDYCNNGKCTGTDYREQCADELSCTDDICDGKGGCVENKLQPNSCLIDGKCFSSGQKDVDQCGICDPTANPNDWTSLTSQCKINGKCYDAGAKDSTGCGECLPNTNPNDWTPIAGLCKIGNTCFPSGAKNSGGCAECDPNVSATAWTVKGDNCLIENTCRNPGDKDSTGCGECVPSKDKAKWSSIPNTCLVGGKCYSPNQTDSTGCGVCDPSKSATEFTVQGNVCLIQGLCYQPNNKDATGCGLCDPSKSKTGWTSIADKCLIVGKCYEDEETVAPGCLVCDTGKSTLQWTATSGTVTNQSFEAGSPAGWAFQNDASSVGWTIHNGRATHGSFALYYGDPAKKNFDSGSINKGTASMPSVSIASGKKAGLRFGLYMDTETGSGYDILEVLVKEGTNTSSVWKKSSTTKMKAWQEVSIDLSSYAGKTITIQFQFNTADSYGNNGEGVYIDEISLFTDC